LGGRGAVFAALILLAVAHGLPWAAFRAGYWLPAAQVSLVAWACFLTGAAFHYLVVRRRMDVAETQSHRYQRAIRYVTHEMRTPLTAIQGSSELIERYELTDDRRKQVAGLIHSESQRLGRMIEMFLGVEKLSSGEIQLQNAAVDAGDLLAACVERARPLAERKQIEIRHGSDAEIFAWGDREFLECACYNLITNAVKYSPAKTSIIVQARQTGGNVQISVEDRGYGMDEKEVKNIFRKFYRTRSAEESGETGSGLGLALVEEIIARHGGTIKVESRVNQGSRFTLSLPRAARNAAPASEYGEPHRHD
jgi:two-component system sensor histidine kinase SenX3